MCVVTWVSLGVFPSAMSNRIHFSGWRAFSGCDNSASNVRDRKNLHRQFLELFQTIRLGLDRISGTMILVNVCQSNAVQLIEEPARRLSFVKQRPIVIGLRYRNVASAEEDSLSVTHREVDK